MNILVLVALAFSIGNFAKASETEDWNRLEKQYDEVADSDDLKKIRAAIETARSFLDKYPKSKKMDQVLGMGKYLFESASAREPSPPELNPLFKIAPKGLASLSREGRSFENAAPNPLGSVKKSALPADLHYLPVKEGQALDDRMVTIAELERIEKAANCKHQVWIARKKEGAPRLAVIKLCQKANAILVSTAGSKPVQFERVYQYPYDCHAVGTGLAFDLNLPGKDLGKPTILAIGPEDRLQSFAKFKFKRIGHRNPKEFEVEAYDLDEDKIPDVTRIKKLIPRGKLSEVEESLDGETRTNVNAEGRWVTIDADNEGPCY